MIIIQELKKECKIIELSHFFSSKRKRHVTAMQKVWHMSGYIFSC